MRGATEGMRDGIEGVRSVFRSEEHWRTTAYSTMVLVSIGPDDLVWFDENCPEWREHISARHFQVQLDITDIEIVEHPFPKILLDEIHRTLAHQLAQAIVAQFEPGITIESAVPR